jgi:uncharacterized membrane protein YcaP (DUF421 family)
MTDDHHNFKSFAAVFGYMMEFIDTALGLNETTLTWWQMSIRAVIVFLAALLIIRVGNPRIFGKQTTFDIILGVIYASILSRAITGNAPFGQTLIAGLVLVLLHRLLAVIAYHVSGRTGYMIKGRAVMIVKDGQLLQEAMKKHSISDRDLQEAMRTSGNISSFSEIETAYLERSGSISIIPKKRDN